MGTIEKAAKCILPSNIYTIETAAKSILPSNIYTIAQSQLKYKKQKLYRKMLF
jgi:hypothetical protein